MGQPILQFGTSRFLQAHVDLFVSQAMDAGQALGGITVVQTTGSPASAERVAAFCNGQGYPVMIRGLSRGEQIDQLLTCKSIHMAFDANSDWPLVVDHMAGDVKVIISNTADRGYQIDDRDTADLIGQTAKVPRSFPAKLVVLLVHRWVVKPKADLSIFPCELVERNGDTLRDVVSQLARKWNQPDDFIAWLHDHCVWANSLVDRIVSEAIKPVGAIAEPYALWAIERQERLVLPCTHESIVVTDDLKRFERLKLFFLNAGHTYLAQRWLTDARAVDETVAHAMNDPLLRADLETLWADEVLPIFQNLGHGVEALNYLTVVRERFLNPYLAHKLGDIAQNHDEKKQRRLKPIVTLAETTSPGLKQPLLRSALANITLKNSK